MWFIAVTYRQRIELSAVRQQTHVHTECVHHQYRHRAVQPVYQYVAYSTGSQTCPLSSSCTESLGAGCYSRRLSLFPSHSAVPPPPPPPSPPPLLFFQFSLLQLINIAKFLSLMCTCCKSVNLINRNGTYLYLPPPSPSSDLPICYITRSKEPRGLLADHVALYFNTKQWGIPRCACCGPVKGPLKSKNNLPCL